MLTATASACTGAASGTAPAPVPGRATADLAALEGTRVLFAHMSVGDNILGALREERARGELRLELHAWAAGPLPSAPGLVHVLAGSNGDPASKLSGFTRALEASNGRIDLALVKFCYIDIDHATDVGRVFEMYRTGLDDLARRYPRTTFVHATVPLKTDEGIKGAVKRLIGRGDPVLANVRRNEYNELLRAYAAAQPLFDLARVESTRPDGGGVTFVWQGRTYEQLAPEYSSDGGHLNAVGSSRAANEFLRVLAEAARARGRASLVQGG